MRSHAKAVVAVLAVLLLTLALAANPASAIAPTVTVEDAFDVSYTSAKVKGEVDRQEQSTTYRFQIVDQPTFEAEGFANPWTWVESTIEEGGPGFQEVEATLESLSQNTTYHLRLQAENADGSSEAVAANTFTTKAVTKPSVSLAISDIAGESAKFEGEINPNAPDSNENLSDAAKAAFATNYRFECTPACPNSPEGTVAADDEPQAVTFDASTLEPNTAYEVKLYASNAGGEEVAEESFSTAAPAPGVHTWASLERGQTNARIEGIVNPYNTETVYWFEYGTDSGYGTSVPLSEDAPVGDGARAIPVAQHLTGLQPGTTYHYRLVATSAAGTSFGEERTVTTRTPEPVGKGVGVNGEREIELVSMPDKNLNPVSGGTISPDGERVLYRVLGGMDGSSTGYAATRYIADRTSTGWRTSSIEPPRSRYPGGLTVLDAMAPDLGTVLGRNAELDGTGVQTLIRTGPAGSETVYPAPGAPMPSIRMPQGLLASDDLSVVHGVRWVNGQPAEDTQVYDYASNPPRIVSLLPDGSAPACGLETNPDGGFAWSGDSASDQHWASRDGSTVFFVTRGSDCDAPPQLYRREGNTTTPISEAPAGEPAGGTYFVKASADGSEVFYTSETRLSEADENDTNDIYRYTDGVGNECVTCVVAEAAVFREPNNKSQAIVSGDGSRVYFVSTKRLVPGEGLGDQFSIYLISGGEVKYVAPFDIGLLGGDFHHGATGRKWAMTPDGSVFLFSSPYELTAHPTAGTAQLYRYDAEEESLACVSCVSGVPADSPSRTVFSSGLTLFDLVTAISDDGSTLFFTTSNALSDTDENGAQDIYEWREGKVALITDGRAKGAPEVNGMVRDGRSVLFVSASVLAPGVTEGEEPTQQLYVARIGGGFPEPVPPVPCAGDGCQGAPKPAPPVEAAGTGSFQGPGNAKPGPGKCAKPKVKRKGRCVKRKASKRAGKQRNANKNRGAGK